MRRQIDDDRYLVTEQPAIGILVAGVLIALFIGLGIRAFLAPQKMKFLVEQTLKPISGQITVEVGSAQVSFAQGWWPRFSLLIANTKLSSENPCWYSPIGEISEIELPVSFWGLLRGELQVREIKVSGSKLILRSDRKACDEKAQTHLQWQVPNAPISAAAPVAPTEPLAIENIPVENVKAPQIRKVSFHNLSLTFGGEDARTLDFELMQLESGEAPSQYRLRGYLNLTGEKLLGGALAPAEFEFQFEKHLVDLHVKGNWREGYYNIRAHYDKPTDQFEVEGALKHLPLSEVVALLSKYGVTTQAFDAKQLWASLDFTSEGELAKSSAAQMQINNFKLEGNLGEIYAEKAEITSLDPLTYKPISLKIARLNLDQLMTALAQTVPSRTLAQLGYLQGDLQIHSESKISYVGVLRDMHMVVSARGQRRIQVIEEAKGSLDFQETVFAADVSDVKLQNGEFAGQLQCSFKSDLSFLKLDAKLQKLKLSPEVEGLMTMAGYMDPWSGDLRFHTEGRRVQNLSGQLQSSQLKIEGIEAKNVSLNLSSLRHDIRVRLQTSAISIAPESVVASFLAPLIQGGLGNIQKIDSLSGVIVTEESGSLRWQDWRASMGSAQWGSEGGWNEVGQIKGSMRMRDGKKKKDWIVKGDRSSPQLEAAP